MGFAGCTLCENRNADYRNGLASCQIGFASPPHLRYTVDQAIGCDRESGGKTAALQNCYQLCIVPSSLRLTGR